MHFDARENTYKIEPTLYGHSKCIQIHKRVKTPEEIEKERIKSSIVNRKIAIYEALKKWTPHAQEYSSQGTVGSSSNYSELKFDQRLNQKGSNPSRSHTTATSYGTSERLSVD